MKLRWFDSIQGIEVAFEAADLDSFKSAVLDFLIDFRVKSRKNFGTSFSYPAGTLEIWLPTGRWYQVRVSDHSAPFTAPIRGAYVTDDGPPDDSQLVSASYRDWWEYAGRNIRSTEHYMAKDKVPATP